jgi:hypothetical protein
VGEGKWAITLMGAIAAIRRNPSESGGEILMSKKGAIRRRSERGLLAKKG